MAITAIQRVPDGEDVWGRMRVRFVDVVLGAYVNPGGLVINASDLGFKMIYAIDVVSQNTGALAWTYYFDANSSMGTSSVQGLPAASVALKAFVITTGLEVGNTISLAAATLRLQVVGR